MSIDDIWVAGDPGIERLRAALLNEVYAGGFSGFPAMLLDEDEIKDASGPKLLEIARRYGLR